MRALALGCFYSPISTGTFQGALTASLHGQLRGDKEYPFSGVTKSGRVWRKVPESDARSVGPPLRWRYLCPALRHHPRRQEEPVADQNGLHDEKEVPGPRVVAHEVRLALHHHLLRVLALRGISRLLLSHMGIFFGGCAGFGGGGESFGYGAARFGRGGAGNVRARVISGLVGFGRDGGLLGLIVLKIVIIILMIIMDSLVC